MRSTVKPILISLTLLFFFSCQEKPGPSPFLHTQGQDIVDGKGNKIMLRGVGLGNWLLPEGYMWKFGPAGDRPRTIEKMVSELIGEEEAEVFWKEFRRNYITEADIRRMAELGYNSVRPALNARLFMTEGDSAEFVEESFILIDSLVSWSGRHGLYVILDMHGAPGGQTGENIDDSPANEPGLFTSAENQNRLERLWLKLAGRYADNPVVLGYDLLNEPLPGYDSSAAKYGHLVEPLYKRLTAAIREIDKNHIIILEGVDWSNDWSIFGRPFADNLVYQFHYYCWSRPDHLNDISKYISLRDTLNAPVWVGETGEKGNTIYWATMQYFETNNIGWSFWPWKKMDTQNTPYSINRPSHWDEIVAYSHGQAKPSAEVARQAFSELLENIKLANCLYFPDVVNSMFRRIPARIEAENYGHEGFGRAFQVADTVRRSAFYRTAEPVPVETINFKEDQFWSDQCVVLGEGEWLAYNFDNPLSDQARLKMRWQARSAEAGAEFILNGQSFPLTMPDNSWQDLDLGVIPVKQGANELKLRVRKGTVAFDWMEFSEK